MTSGVSRAALLVGALFTGLFAGLMSAFVIAVDRMLALLSATMYVTVMQHLIRSADVPPLVPGMVIVALIAPVVALIGMRRDTKSPAFRWTLAGFALFCTGAFLLTVLFNAPLNFVILKWSAESPPSDWAAVRERWHALNWVRVFASIAAFVCYLLALTRPAAGAAPGDIARG